MGGRGMLSEGWAQNLFADGAQGGCDVVLGRWVLGQGDDAAAAASAGEFSAERACGAGDIDGLIEGCGGHAEGAEQAVVDVHEFAEGGPVGLLERGDAQVNEGANRLDDRV